MSELQRALGESPAMRTLGDRLQRVVTAGTRRLPPILIEGETGTGKSFLAAMLHRSSARAAEPFVSVNCAAIPRELLEAELFGYERGAFTGARGAKPGLFQVATRGTLFLDEIGYLGEDVQAKLLSVLEERSVRRVGATRSEPVDLWIVAATTSDLRRTSREGTFLEALFHRLAVVTVRLPPLRERGDDALTLADELLRRACAHYDLPPKRLSDDARAALRAYPFPGNVRELGNLMERVALLQSSTVVTGSMLELPSGPSIPSGEDAGVASTDDPELLVTTLGSNDWNISRTASQLGIPRSTLRSRILRHGLRPPRGRSEFPTAMGPERNAILEIVAGREGDPRAPDIARAFETARRFGAKVTPIGSNSGRAVFALDRFEDGARSALAAARAIDHVFAASGSEYRVVLDTGIFASDQEIALAAPTRTEIGHLPAGLVVSETAAALVRRQIHTEPIGAGWRRLRALSAPAQPGNGLAPLVGRTSELAVLRQRLEVARGGRGQLLGVQGDVGLGKSRLVAEMLPIAKALGFAIVECGCLAYGRQMPYVPIVEIARALCAVAPGDDTATVAERLRSTVERLDIDGELARPLAQLLGIAAPDSEATPEAAQLATRRSLIDLLLAAARETPLLVVLEDVQWIDGASRDVLAALVQEVPAAALALVTTYRSGAAPDWMSRPQATQLSLPPLSRRESIELGRAVVLRSAIPRGGQIASAETVNAIIERADGNPFFIEELALAVEESGHDPSGPLPASIIDVVRSRIFALSGRSQRVLATASIAGRTCPISLLEALLPGDPELALRLDDLARLDLVVSRTRGRERVLVFRHAVTQEVAYEILPTAERRRLHGEAARSIEAAHVGCHEEALDLLAHHHARGDDPARAVDVLARAVVKAVAANALDAARADHEEAVRLLDALPGTTENRRRRVLLYVGEHIVPLFFLLLQVESYLAVLEGLEDDARALADPALLGMLYARKGHCLWWVGRFNEAVAASEQALSFLQPLGLPLLAVYTFRANALYAKGDFVALLALEQATREVVERERHVRWSAYVLGAIAWSHVRMGNRDRAVSIAEQSLGLIRERGDASVTSFVHWSMALVASETADSELALEHARRSVDVAPTPADRMWAESVEAVVLCRRTEDAERGTAALRPLVAASRQSNLLAVEELFVPALGEGYVRLGRLAEARSVFEELLARSERYGMRYLEAVACGWLATIARLAGEAPSPCREREEQILGELNVPTDTSRALPHGRSAALVS